MGPGDGATATAPVAGAAGDARFGSATPWMLARRECRPLAIVRIGVSQVAYQSAHDFIFCRFC